MSNTEKYYETHKQFRDSMRGLQAERAKALEKIERFKGGQGYEKEVATIEADYRRNVQRVADVARVGFSEAVRCMGENASKETPMKVPTPEQETLLRTLQMKEKITAKELEQASELLKGNRLALSILDEIAVKHNYASQFADPDVSSNIRALSNFANTTLRMPFVDHRAEWANGDQKQIDFFSADRDFSDTADCISYAGGVRNVKDFQELVD